MEGCSSWDGGAGVRPCSWLGDGMPLRDASDGVGALGGYPQSLCLQRGWVAGYPGGAEAWAYHPPGNEALAPRGTLLRELVADAAYVAGVPGFLESWVVGYPRPELVVEPRRRALSPPVGEGFGASSVGGSGIHAPVPESQIGSASEVGSASVSGSGRELSVAGSVAGASFLGSGGPPPLLPPRWVSLLG